MLRKSYFNSPMAIRKARRQASDFFRRKVGEKNAYRQIMTATSSGMRTSAFCKTFLRSFCAGFQSEQFAKQIVGMLQSNKCRSKKRSHKRPLVGSARADSPRNLAVTPESGVTKKQGCRGGSPTKWSVRVENPHKSAVRLASGVTKTNSKGSAFGITLHF